MTLLKSIDDFQLGFGCCEGNSAFFLTKFSSGGSEEEGNVYGGRMYVWARTGGLG